MTPLAMYFTNQLTLPIKDRDPFCADNSAMLRDAFTNVHCFECTEILPILSDVASTIDRKKSKDRSEAFGELLFLPAPKTWIELRAPLYRGRIGYLLQEIMTEEGSAASVELFTEESGGGSMIGWISLVSDDHKTVGSYPDGSPREIILPTCFKELFKVDAERAIREMLSLLHFLLITVNAPKIIGRRQHMPHRALERHLIKTFGVGKFPLHAWTEIKLEIAKPIEIDDGEPHEAHLTGRRALHFCRKHIRIRFGKLEYVSAHWRGDAALGIKQSRYRLVPPRERYQ